MTLAEVRASRCAPATAFRHVSHLMTTRTGAHVVHGFGRSTCRLWSVSTTAANDRVMCDSSNLVLLRRSDHLIADVERRIAHSEAIAAQRAVSSRDDLGSSVEVAASDVVSDNIRVRFADVGSAPALTMRPESLIRASASSILIRR